ncbi:MAG: hypothetical protein COA78_08850 [Blastopirellula sp.]|nr:MAG: hypothetical protein COA78_08850 [Blastopirellula sp.]
MLDEEGGLSILRRTLALCKDQAVKMDEYSEVRARLAHQTTEEYTLYSTTIFHFQTNSAITRTIKFSLQKP